MKKEFILMKEIVLGRTGIKVPQNAFGALPVRRMAGAYDED